MEEGKNFLLESTSKLDKDGRFKIIGAKEIFKLNRRLNVLQSWLSILHEFKRASLVTIAKWSESSN